MTETKIDLSKYHNALSRKSQIIRLLWAVTWAIFARPLPRSVGSGWKRTLLRLFGAKIDKTGTGLLSGKSGDGALLMPRLGRRLLQRRPHNYRRQHDHLARRIPMHSKPRHNRPAQPADHRTNRHRRSNMGRGTCLHRHGCHHRTRGYRRRNSIGIQGCTAVDSRRRQSGKRNKETQDK